MKRATRTLTLWTTSIRWTLITNRIFERSISNITFQNNLSKQSLWETLTYSVYTIYIASSPRICYLHFLFSNKSRYFSRFHVETTERSRGSQEGEKKWESSRRFDTVEKKIKEKERRILRMFVKPLSGRRTLAVCPYVTWAKIASKKTKPLASEASFVARVLHRVFFS